MREYYIQMDTIGTNKPVLIDEEQMYQAERGMNYLNPDDFMFACEADCLHDAIQQCLDEFWQTQVERMHP